MLIVIIVGIFDYRLTEFIVNFLRISVNALITFIQASDEPFHVIGDWDS